MTSEKITVAHLTRRAYIYIRQSTPEQVHNHLESQRLQYQLVDLAKEYGWPNPEIIDEDQGRSGSGTVARPGFMRLMSAVVKEQVGAIFCLEASRLSRNIREWSQLIEFCFYFNTLIIDPGGIHDPQDREERMVLGIQGAVYEFETSTFRQRAQSAILAKAERGEYYNSLPAGYELTPDKKKCIKDPNQRVQDAIDLIFNKFQLLGSALAVVAFLQSENIEVPCRGRDGEIFWKVPTSSLLKKILKNPIYAGAYVYGRSQTVIRIIDDHPVKSSSDLPPDKWKVLKKDHHPYYITWDQYMANQNRLEQNQNKRGQSVKGAPKHGAALLAGLLKCQSCGHKFRVRYSASHGGVPRYVCKGQEIKGHSENCLGFSGAQLEQFVIKLVFQVVEPATIAAAEAAAELVGSQQNEKIRYVQNQLKQAQYEADRCFEQYNSVDPKNRLVAQNLETSWNEALEKQRQLEQQLIQLEQAYQPLSETDRQAINRLAKSLPEIWYHPQADNRVKKRILQTLIEAIWVKKAPENHLEITIHWAGGVHTQHHVQRRKSGQRPNYLNPETEKIIRGLAELEADADIARNLNLVKIQTASGKNWTENSVRDFRHRHKIPVFDPSEYEKKGWGNLQEAARILGTSPTAVSRLIQAKILPARQIIKYSPWIIENDQLSQPQVISAVSRLKSCKRTELNPGQGQLQFEPDEPI
ncbi:recombinase family protein [candidate division KSB1 bacterium]|nr:recombinase family protein [candidate division KSB1 bacterium]